MLYNQFYQTASENLHILIVHCDTLGRDFVSVSHAFMLCYYVVKWDSVITKPNGTYYNASRIETYLSITLY